MTKIADKEAITKLIIETNGKYKYISFLESTVIKNKYYAYLTREELVGENVIYAVEIRNFFKDLKLYTFEGMFNSIFRSLTDIEKVYLKKPTISKEQLKDIIDDTIANYLKNKEVELKELITADGWIDTVQGLSKEKIINSINVCIEDFG